MRQQMAETASLLASASYEQPQAQLQHYQVKLHEHLADPTKPLDLEMEGTACEEQAQGHAEGGAEEQEPSTGKAQFSESAESAPKTPNVDAAAKAARAKRVASSREVGAHHSNHTVSQIKNCRCSQCMHTILVVAHNIH